MIRADYQKLTKTLLNDKRVQRLKAAFDELPEYNLPLKALRDEAEMIHKIRKTRFLNASDPNFSTHVVEALLLDQQHRARLTEMLMSCISVTRNLGHAIDNLEGYLLMQYSSEISCIRTKQERVDFIKHVILKDCVRYIQKVSMLKEILDVVILDIDKAGFMYKNLISAVETATGRRSIL